MRPFRVLMSVATSPIEMLTAVLPRPAPAADAWPSPADMFGVDPRGGTDRSLDILFHAPVLS